MKKSMGLLLFYFACVSTAFSQVSLFKSGDFSGEKLEISKDWGYVSNMDWNDKINSIKVPKGWKAVAYEHCNGEGMPHGQSIEITGDWTAPSEWKNKISGIRLYDANGNNILFYRKDPAAGAYLQVAFKSVSIQSDGTPVYILAVDCIGGATISKPWFPLVNGTYISAPNVCKQQGVEWKVKGEKGKITTIELGKTYRKNALQGLPTAIPQK